MKTVESAMKLLEVLMSGHEGRKLNELAEICGLNRTTTFKILSDLTKFGFVRKTHGNSVYELGEKLTRPQQEILRRTDLQPIARPYLESLAEKTGQTVDMLFLVGDRGYYLDILNEEATDNPDHIGEEENLVKTSVGRAILAYLPEETVRKMAEKQIPLEDIPDFEKELELTRKRGFAVQDGEIRRNSRGVAAPIFGSYQQVIGSICVSGVAEKISISSLLEYSDLVCKTAREITKALQQ